MKYRTTKQFDKVDLHDSVIKGIEANPSRIKIFLSFANLLAEHEANPYNVAKCIEPCVLTFLDVSKAEAVLWNDKNREYEQHPSPDAPIQNEIMESKQLGSMGENPCYSLSGWHRAGWSEWTICCSGFELCWEQFSGDAWFVNWPPESK